MIVNVGICATFLIVLTIIVLVYFSKPKIDTIENSIFKKQIGVTVLGLFLESIIYFLITNHINISSNILIILTKFLYVYYVFWMYFFVKYNFVIFFKDKIDYKKIKNAFIIMTIFYIMFFLVSIFLPIDYTLTDTYYYPGGIGTFLQYVIVTLGMSVIGVFGFMNYRKLKSKESLPMIICMILGIISIVVQYFYHEFLFIVPSHAIAVILMYFTIENPDMRMVEELTRNRKLTEDNFEEKSNFLFKISQDLKGPLKEIVDKSQEIVNKSSIEENALDINLNSRQLYTYVNNALDVSQMDVKNLRILDSVYNSNNFFEEICKRTETEIKNSGKDIEFRFDISKTLPEFLSGDNTKLKQIILSLLFNSIKHTKNGFIELSVNSIVKYGVCRLMIDVSDCGGGMPLGKINRVLSSSGELTKSEVDKINSLNIDLSLVYKMVKVLNGNFIIKSEKELGTSFLVIIDQKIENKKKDDVNSFLKTGSKILLISDDEDLSNKIKDKLSGIDVEQSLFIRDALEKLDNRDIKCILIDNKLNEMNGLGVLKELGTDIPCVIVIGENEKFLGKHFIEDGFKNFIIKEFVDDELSKIDEFM